MNPDMYWGLMAIYFIGMIFSIFLRSGYSFRFCLYVFAFSPLWVPLMATSIVALIVFHLLRIIMNGFMNIGLYLTNETIEGSNG